MERRGRLGGVRCSSGVDWCRAVRFGEAGGVTKGMVLEVIWGMDC